MLIQQSTTVQKYHELLMESWIIVLRPLTWFSAETEILRLTELRKVGANADEIIIIMYEVQ